MKDPSSICVQCELKQARQVGSALGGWWFVGRPDDGE